MGKVFYKTSDLALSAALSVYYPISSIDRDNPNKVYFIFQKDKNFDLIVERYWHGDLKIDPQTYFNSLKILKTRIYERVWKWILKNL